MTMAVSNPQRNVPEIISDLFSQLATLVRKETLLARTEISENVAGVGRSLGLIIGGAVLLIPALVILLQAATAGLTEGYGLKSYWSALIVGGAVLIIGLILLLAGSSRLKIENMMPNRTVHQLRRDASVAQQQVSREHDLDRAA
jgi:hypothetical protein